ncbi:phage baseplate protein [Klebsiella michiganensis]|uniref:phage baseplate protein n=1 Tax=Klebsiella michiganensis TaxID=1134687 RepID=UPI003516D39B
MATPGSLTIGGDSSRINSTQNSNNSSATRNKGENGFTILASVYNPASDSYIQNYQAIVFDAVTDTGIRRQAEITSYPVESGAEVSDHVQIKNNTFKLSGVITETPVRLEKDLLYSAGVNGTRISQAIQYLDKIFDSRQPITLVTEHKVYENVILSGISYDYKSEFAMQFDLEFEQIRLVSTATVNVIATKTQSNRSVGGTVKQKVVNNAPKKTESDTVTTEFNKK